MIAPSPDMKEVALVKSDSFSVDTDFTSSSSDNDSVSDEFSSASSIQSSTRQSGKKSVRFSVVYTREFNVVDELAPPDEDDDGSSPVRRSLGWEYTEKESDLETHMGEVRKERKAKYLIMIQEHITNVEFEREEREKNLQQKKKNKGFKSKVLKPLWKGFLDAASRSSMVIPTPYG